MRLPNAHQARVDQATIVDYLLCLGSADGHNKAVFFYGLGFRVEQWQEFAEALRSHGRAHEVVEVERTVYGMKYVVIGAINTPDGRNPRAKTVWMIGIESATPRFITAYPTG